ncbi:unnamed protein product, partial [Protopolystoma xenopodis]
MKTIPIVPSLSSIPSTDASLNTNNFSGSYFLLDNAISSLRQLHLLMSHIHRLVPAFGNTSFILFDATVTGLSTENVQAGMPYLHDTWTIGPVRDILSRLSRLLIRLMHGLCHVSVQ